MSRTLYNCKTAVDGWTFVKFDPDFNIGAIYTVKTRTEKPQMICDCPGWPRKSICKHTRMVNTFALAGAIDTDRFYCYELQKWFMPLLNALETPTPKNSLELKPLELHQLELANKLLENCHKTETDCLVWLGGRVTDGYGMIYYQGVSERTHRVAYRLFKGPIPDGKWVLHTCDNPSCCNPEHLFIGDVQTNSDNKYSKGRGVIGESNGRAQLTEAQVIEIKELLSKGTYTQETIGQMFGVSRDCINNNKQGRVWKHLETQTWHQPIQTDGENDPTAEKAAQIVPAGPTTSAALSTTSSPTSEPLRRRV